MKPVFQILYFIALVLTRGAAYLIAVQNDELLQSSLSGWCVRILSLVLGWLMGCTVARFYFERVNPE